MSDTGTPSAGTPAGTPTTGTPAGSPAGAPAGHPGQTQDGTNGNGGQQAAGAPGADTGADTDWKAAARKWEQRAKENQTAAERLAQLEQSQMSELEKAQQAAAEKGTRLETTERELWRAQVALRHGLTETQAKRLVGATLDEFEADAAQLRKDMGLDKTGPAPVPGRPVENMQAVQVPAGEGAGLTNMDEWMRQRAAR